MLTAGSCLGAGTYIKKAVSSETLTSKVSHNKSIDKLSVQDFGAVGDGIQDDTLAIQSCIDAIIDNGGGTVYFPKGNYLISRSGSDVIYEREVQHCLKVEGNNVHLQLDEEATLKIADKQAKDEKITAIRIGDKTGQLGSNFLLSGAGKIDADWRKQSSNAIEKFHAQILHSSAIIVFGKLQNITIQDLTISGSQGNGIFIASPDTDINSRMKNVTVQDVIITDCAEGIVWLDADDVTIKGCEIDVFLQDGIEPARFCTNYKIIDNIIKSVGPKNHAIDLYGGDNGLVENNVIYNSGMNIGVGLRIENETQNVVVRNNILNNSSIFIDPAGKVNKNITLENNTFNNPFPDHPSIRLYRLEEHAEILNVIIKNNQIKESDGSSIYISNWCENVSIENNLIEGCNTSFNECIKIKSENVRLLNNSIR